MRIIHGLVLAMGTYIALLNSKNVIEGHSSHAKTNFEIDDVHPFESVSKNIKIDYLTTKFKAETV